MTSRFAVRDAAERIILVRVTAMALGLLEGAAILGKETPWGIRLVEVRRCLGTLVQDITDAN